jgi:hypothetical protein
MTITIDSINLAKLVILYVTGYTLGTTGKQLSPMEMADLKRIVEKELKAGKHLKAGIAYDFIINQHMN